MGFTTQEVCSDVSLLLVDLWLYNCVVNRTRQHVGRGESGRKRSSFKFRHLLGICERGRERGIEREATVGDLIILREKRQSCEIKYASPNTHQKNIGKLENRTL